MCCVFSNYLFVEALVLEAKQVVILLGFFYRTVKGKLTIKKKTGYIAQLIRLFFLSVSRRL